MTLDWFFRQAWLRAAGLPEDRQPEPVPALDELQRTEWCHAFEQLMRRRLIMGAFRYGRFRDQRKATYDCPGAIARRLKAYEADGNLEHLVDIANLAMVEFVVGKHPRRHFWALDDGQHCERTSPCR